MSVYDNPQQAAILHYTVNDITCYVNCVIIIIIMMIIGRHITDISLRTAGKLHFCFRGCPWLCKGVTWSHS